MKILSLIIAFMLTLPFTCNKQDDKIVPEDYNGLKIESAFECGWGSGADSLIITKSTVSYYYYIPATSPLPKVAKSRAITENEWAEISAAVNMSEFQKLNYNTCNICVDGCDEWIIINTGSLSHQIRFSKGQQITEISRLQEILAQFRSELGS